MHNHATRRKAIFGKTAPNALKSVTFKNPRSNDAYPGTREMEPNPNWTDCCNQNLLSGSGQLLFPYTTDPDTLELFLSLPAIQDNLRELVPGAVVTSMDDVMDPGRTNSISFYYGRPYCVPQAHRAMEAEVYGAPFGPDFLALAANNYRN